MEVIKPLKIVTITSSKYLMRRECTHIPVITGLQPIAKALAMQMLEWFSTLKSHPGLRQRVICLLQTITIIRVMKDMQRGITMHTTSQDNRHNSHTVLHQVSNLARSTWLLHRNLTHRTLTCILPTTIQEWQVLYLFMLRKEAVDLMDWMEVSQVEHKLSSKA